MNDRVFKPQFLFNNNKSNNTNSKINSLDITNTLNKDSCDQDFYEIFQFYSMILTQDINKLCNKESVLRIPIIPLAIVEKLCNSVKKIFETEDILLHLQGQMIIIGDLHGHIMDLFRIIKRFGLPPRTRYLFLGDIVDRGEFSLETIIFIYVMKVLFPNEIYIIRGNHEFEEVCSLSGFLDDIQATYKSKELFSFFIESFDVMPIAATINESILCVHAGIGPNLHSITDITEKSNDTNQSLDFNTENQSMNLDQKLHLIQRPIHDFSNDIIVSLMWSDPTEKRQENRKELPSLISPLTGARILTVRPVIENKRTKRAISNDFNINQLKLAFPKNPGSEDTINESEQAHLTNLRNPNEDDSKADGIDLNTPNSNNNNNNNINYVSYASISSSNKFQESTNTTNIPTNFTTSPNLITNDQNNIKYSEGFSPSSRGYGYLFDKTSFDIFMANSNLSLLLRGHQCVHSGISNTFDNRLTTVFSASHYCGSSNNSCGVFIISKFGNRTEIFKSLPYLRRSLVVFIPPERDDAFVIPKSLKPADTTATTVTTARPRINNFTSPSPSSSSHTGSCMSLPQHIQVQPLQNQPQVQQQPPKKKKAQIFSPASLIATKGFNPLATFEADTARSEDDEVDPFEIHDDEDEGSGFRPSFGFGSGFGAAGNARKTASKRHSALSQFSSLTNKKLGRIDGVGVGSSGFASDEQEITSRRFLRLPCINQAKKPVSYGDV